MAYKARLCVRGDLLQPDAPIGYSAPAVSRCSPLLLIFIAISLRFAIGILDISPVSTQCELVEKTRRIQVFPPWRAPLPFRGSLNTDKTQVRHPTLAPLTLRPLYGTSCAPRRWFSTISRNHRASNWVQLKAGPRIFRLVIHGDQCALATLHVGDALCVANEEGLGHSQIALAPFRNSGIKYLSDNESVL